MLNANINDVTLTELFNANEYIKIVDTKLFDGTDYFI